MKQIDGKATRVLKYDRAFFLCIPAFGLFAAGLSLAANGWNWAPVAGGVFGGLLIGAVAGVLLRDVP